MRRKGLAEGCLQADFLEMVSLYFNEIEMWAQKHLTTMRGGLRLLFSQDNHSSPEGGTMTRTQPVLLVALLSLLPAIASASPVLIDFEGLDDLASVDGLIPGITFTHATVLTAGISLDEFEFPPASGAKVAFDDGGPMRIDFANPIAAFRGRFTYSSPLTLEAFDAGGLSLGMVSSAFGSSLALSGDPGSRPNERLKAAFGSISYVIIKGDPLGTSFTVDDVRISPTTVPEPATFGLMFLGATAILLRRKWNKRSVDCG